MMDNELDPEQEELMKLSTELDIAIFMSPEHYHVFQFMKVNNGIFRLFADIQEGLRIYTDTQLKKILDDLYQAKLIRQEKKQFLYLTEEPYNRWLHRLYEKKK